MVSILIVVFSFDYSAISYVVCIYTVGEGGINGDGDITKPENLTAFREYVMEHTGHMGVHFVMGDGVSIILLEIFAVEPLCLHLCTCCV